VYHKDLSIPIQKKRIILAGKGGSGKDYLKDIMVSQGLEYSVSHTTRPPRFGEIHGKDYYFVGDEEFEAMNSEDQFYEIDIFNGWKYGTSLFEFETKRIFIMTPRGISNLTPDDRSESVIIYLDINESIRRERLSKRKDADDVERRILADKKDFLGFDDYDYVIISPDFTPDNYWDLLRIRT
jgi:guanylate kinase